MAISIEDFRLPGPAQNYASGTLTSGAATITGRIWGVRLFASGADATVTLSATSPTLSGDTITLRDGTGVDIAPRLRWQDLTITHGTGTVDYLVFYA